MSWSSNLQLITDKESLSTLKNELFTRYALHAEAAAVPQIKDAKGA